MDPGPDAPIADARMDAATDAKNSIIITGTQYIPTPTAPVNLALSSRWAFYSLNIGEVPAGKTLAGVDLCATSGNFSTIDGPEECPSPTPSLAQGIAGIKPYRVQVGIAESATHLWKARAHYLTGQEDLGEVSEYSAVQTFSTNNSTKFWLQLNENTGISAADSSGGNTGTLQNGTSWTSAGVSGSAIQLDGVDDHVLVNDADVFDLGDGDFTLSAWVYLESPVGARAILDKRNATNGFEFYALNGALEFYGVGCGYVTRSAVMTPNAWHYGAVTRRKGVVVMSLDGEPSGSPGTCNDNFSNTAKLGIGCNPPEIGCQEALHGKLDEPIIRDEAVSQETLRNDFRAGAALLGILP